MDYYLSNYEMNSIVVDNTRFSKGVVTIIIVCTIIGALLIAGGVFLIIKFHDRCSCLSDCSLSDFLSCFTCCNRTYSDNVTSSYSNDNNTTTNMKNELQYHEPEPVPAIQTPEVHVTNSQPDEKEEKPYYLEQKQNQNYYPPQDQGNYPIPEYNNNNQIPPTDSGVYNNAYYPGGNDAYQ